MRSRHARLTSQVRKKAKKGLAHKLFSIKYWVVGIKMMLLYLRYSNFEALASNNAWLNFKEVTEFRPLSPFAERILGKYS